jgi:hypothetical protein
MPTINPCFDEKQSCSACCGLYNLKLSDSERRAWVDENTRHFLALDIARAETIVAYRKEREAVTLPQRIRDDIYVCPFVGFTSGSKTGCLLHPQGSPHPQIGLWPHPQNFSFYGEGICLSYDCLAKERKAYRADFFAWAETATQFQYGRLASDHTLHRTLAALPLIGADLAGFYTKLAGLYEEHGVVTTSFEDIEKALPASAEELCNYLARRIRPDEPEQIAAQLLSSLSQNLKKSP